MSNVEGMYSVYFIKRLSEASGSQRLQRLRLGKRFHPSTFDIRYSAVPGSFLNI